MSKEFALIVAGGKGTRFGSATPKQFLKLNDQPVLLHTLEAFYRYSDQIQIVLVLPEDDMATWETIVRTYDYRRPVMIQAGGNTRFQSVRSGLDRLPSEGYVAIHDGVRPLVTTSVIGRSFSLAREHGSGIAAVPLKESLRLIEQDSYRTVALDRSKYRLVQTPQTFELGLIKTAYRLKEEDTMTDDASVAERAGFPVTLFEGDYSNIKITGPEDLSVAEALLSVARK